MMDASGKMDGASITATHFGFYAQQQDKAVLLGNAIGVILPSNAMWQYAQQNHRTANTKQKKMGQMPGNVVGR